MAYKIAPDESADDNVRLERKPERPGVAMGDNH